MRYRAGQRVRVAARPHEGHHRTPGYVKGKIGTRRARARVVHEPRDAGLRRGRAARSSRSTSSASRSATSGPTTRATPTTGSTSTSSSTGWRRRE